LSIEICGLKNLQVYILNFTSTYRALWSVGAS